MAAVLPLLNGQVSRRDIIKLVAALTLGTSLSAVIDFQKVPVHRRFHAGALHVDVIVNQINAGKDMIAGHPCGSCLIFSGKNGTVIFSCYNLYTVSVYALFLFCQFHRM